MHASPSAGADRARIRRLAKPWVSRAVGLRRPLLAAACAIALTAEGQAKAVERQLYDVSGGPFDLSGFRDAETRDLVIPLRFERVRKFSEGVAAVRDKGLWGYIDTTGAWVITPRFQLAGDFHDGLAAIEAGKFVGVIDRTGKIVIEPQFARVEPFASDIVMATEGEVGPRGVYPGYETVGGNPGVNARKGLYKIGRGWITGASLEINPFDPQRGLFWAKRKDEKLWGIMRLDGSWFMEPRYNAQCDRLRDGLAYVHSFEDDERRPEGFRTGAIDADGHVVIPLRRWFIQHAQGDRFHRVREDGRQGLIDGKGRLLGDRLFDEIKVANGGFAVRVGDAWSFLSEDNTLSPPKEDAFDRKMPGSDLILRRVAEGKFRIIGPDGAPTTPETFDKVADYGASPWAASLVGASGETRWGFLDARGRPIEPGFAFELVSRFVEDRALVRLDDQWGLIDPSGRFVVAPAYDDLLPAGRFPATNGVGLFSPGPRTERAEADGWRLFIGVKDKRAVALDRDGVERPLPPEDDPTAPRPAASRLETKGGLRFATLDGFWGMTNRDGKWIIPPRYRALHEFRQGEAWAPIDKKRRWCPVGPDGVVRDNPACIEERHPFIMSHHWPEKLTEDRYESSVLWSRAYLEFLAGVRDEAPKMIGDGVRSKGSYSIIR